jgi:hypothetical protein
MGYQAVGLIGGWPGTPSPGESENTIVTTTKARSGPRTIIGLLAALGLVAALAMPVFGADTWATVDGYATGSAENNEAGAWAEYGDCVKLPTPEGGWSATYVLPELGEGLVYTLVVVKAGSDQSTEEGANTLFEFPAAGETVWADTVADGEFGEGDKNISHIIVCTGEEAGESEPAESMPEESEAAESQPAESQPEESEAAESQPAESIREGVEGGNPTPTGEELPDTAAGQFGQIPATVLSLVLLGALAAMVTVRLARQR